MPLREFPGDSMSVVAMEQSNVARILRRNARGSTAVNAHSGLAGLASSLAYSRFVIAATGQISAGKERETAECGANSSRSTPNSKVLGTERLGSPRNGTAWPSYSVLKITPVVGPSLLTPLVTTRVWPDRHNPEQFGAPVAMCLSSVTIHCTNVGPDLWGPFGDGCEIGAALP
jgi:hypothetical protein